MAENPYIAAVGPLPVFLERAKQTLLRMPVYVDDTLTAPDSGTITIYDGTQTAIVDGAAVTITDDIASYTLTAATVPDTLTLSEDWLIEWALTMDTGDADAEVVTVRQPAQLCRRALYPVVTTSDLTKRHSDLNTLLPSGQSDWNDQVEEAWVSVQTRLIASGHRPWLIISAWALRELHLYTALAVVFRDLATYTQGGGRYAELAETYRTWADSAWDRLSLSYDEEDSGWPGNATDDGADSVLYLNVGRGWWTHG